MVFNIGFTGTQKGMTEKQRSVVWRRLANTAALWEVGVRGHMGDCIGADLEFWEMCTWARVRTVGHPPLNPAKRAWCTYDEEWEPKEYLERNKDIVDCSDLLVVTPYEMEEVLRSGTWSTWRYARKVGVIRVVVLPDGDIMKI